MKGETRTWLTYADENLDVAVLAFDHGHLNACLQNAQQAVEEYLKAMIVERSLEFTDAPTASESCSGFSLIKGSP
jgi:HEPN domain-containing protein